MLVDKLPRPNPPDANAKPAIEAGGVTASEREQLPRLDLMSGGRIPSLDGLRAISILMVSLSHFVKAGNSPLPAWMARFRELGRPGVDVFFVISGFLITLILLREIERTGQFSLKRFYIRRAVRILPAYAVFLAGTFLLTRAGVADLDGRSWLLATTYTVNMVTHPASWIGHVWSLSVEEHFYVIWPIALYCLGQRGGRYFLIAWLLLAPALRCMIWTRSGNDVVDIDVFTFTRLDTIAIGCLLAFWSRSERAAAIAERIRPWTTAIVVAAALGIYFSNVVLVQSGKYTLMLKYGVEGLLVASIIFTSACHPQTIAGRLLNWSPLVIVGVLSYSLYLWQPFLELPSERWPFAWPWNVAATSCFAVASYLLVERPFLKLKFGRPG